MCGARVLLVPGLCGSALLDPASGETIWPGPLAIGEGRLDLLTWPRPVQVGTVLGVAYDALCLALELAGWRVDTHPYDWRRPLRDLARELAERIARDGEPTVLIGHSLGGVMAALVADAPLIVRAIVVCAPLRGTDAPLAFQNGTSLLIRALGTVDLEHSSTEIAGITRSWPSMTDLVSVRVLAQASRVICIAGIGTATAEGEGMSDGDGMVARTSAAPDGMPSILVGGIGHVLACDHVRTVESVEWALRWALAPAA